jgi:hypothetical protein
LETDGITDLEVDRLIVNLGGSDSESSVASDMEIEDDLDSYGQLE